MAHVNPWDRDKQNAEQAYKDTFMTNPTPTSACKCGHDDVIHEPNCFNCPCHAFQPSDLAHVSACCVAATNYIGPKMGTGYFQCGKCRKPCSFAPAKVSLPVNQWPDGKPPAPAKEEKCSKHGVVHKNGGYPSCAPSPSIEEIVARTRKQTVENIVSELEAYKYDFPATSKRAFIRNIRIKYGK